MLILAEKLSPGSRLSAGARSASLPARRLRQGFFRPTREWLPGPDVLRGIAYDDGSGDCLDNRELKQVVAHVHRELGRPWTSWAWTRV